MYDGRDVVVHACSSDVRRDFLMDVDVDVDVLFSVRSVRSFAFETQRFFPFCADLSLWFGGAGLT